MLDGYNMEFMVGRMDKAEIETMMPMMPKMMTTMMPECLNVMLPYVPTGNRTDFAARMVATLMEKKSEGMFEEETKKIMGKIQELVKK